MNSSGNVTRLEASGALHVLSKKLSSINAYISNKFGDDMKKELDTVTERLNMLEEFVSDVFFDLSKKHSNELTLTQREILNALHQERDFSLSEKIEMGCYESKIHVPLGATKEEKKLIFKRISEDSSRLIDLFKRDLEKEHGTEKNPKKDKLFSIAWEEGHSSGFYDVASKYSELSELIM